MNALTLVSNAYYQVNDLYTVLTNPQHMRLGMQANNTFFNPEEPMRTHYKGLYFEQDKYLMSISPVRLLWNAGATFYNYERFFTVEAWIRFDTNTAKQMAKGKLAYVY